MSNLTIEVPPLRERTDDIPLLCADVLKKYGMSTADLDALQLQILSAYPWPGNIRELLALIERYCILCDKGKKDSNLLKDLVDQQKRLITGEANFEPAEVHEQPSLRRDIEKMRRELISEFIDQHGGDRRLAAKELGVSYTTLWREMRGWKDD